MLVDVDCNGYSAIDKVETERARAGGTTNGSGSELVAVLIIERRARSPER